MLILNTDHNIVDIITLFKKEKKAGLPKTRKTDLGSSTLKRKRKGLHIALVLFSPAKQSDYGICKKGTGKIYNTNKLKTTPDKRIEYRRHDLGKPSVLLSNRANNTQN